MTWRDEFRKGWEEARVRQIWLLRWVMPLVFTGLVLYDVLRGVIPRDDLRMLLISVEQLLLGVYCGWLMWGRRKTSDGPPVDATGEPEPGE